MSKAVLGVIGAGQLGSRHLQALAKLPNEADVFVVDPSAAALSIAAGRVKEVAGWDRHRFVYSENIKALPKFMDVVVVATAAHVRRGVLEDLLAEVKVRYLVLEKVLFQCSEDCRQVGRLLEQLRIPTWVNAPRRMWPFYEGLKDILAEERLLSLSYSGGGWGLACNAYHILDLAAFLTGCDGATLRADFLDAQPVPSKRQGFYELTGTLTGLFANRMLLVVADHRDCSRPAILTLETTRRMLCISEAQKSVTVLSGPVFPDDLKLAPLYQSELTHLVVEDLFSKGTCRLTPYAEASRLHQAMLDAFLTRFSQGEERILRCPIT